MQILDRLPGERGREYALRTLRHNIINNLLPPGSAVSEKELAEQLQLSRTPVREAIIDLSKYGVVEVYPQRGSAVALIDYAMVDEAQFMRKTLECAVAESLARGEIAQPGALAQLHANLAMQEYYTAHVGQDNAGELFALDNEFHRLLFVAGGKERVRSLMEGLEIHFDRVRNLYVQATKEAGDSGRRTLEDHRAIAAAIEARDPAKAGRCMAEHLSHYRMDEAMLRATYPQYFKG